MDIPSEKRIDVKAAVGLANRKLIEKLNRRRRMATGSRVVRACICEK